MLVKQNSYISTHFSLLKWQLLGSQSWATFSWFLQHLPCACIELTLSNCGGKTGEKAWPYPESGSFDFQDVVFSSPFSLDLHCLSPGQSFDGLL